MSIYFPIQNKYFHWYQNLIQKAKNRKLDDTVYKENHHILPRCLGGNNDNENLVFLTLREHYIAHLLLSKFYCGEAGRKMHYAMWIMLLQQKKRGSRVFEMYRTKYIETSLKTQVITDEFRKNVSKALTGKKKTKTEKALKRYEIMKTEMRGSGNHMYGKKHSDETKKKISEKAKGRKPTKESIEKRLAKMKGMKRKAGCNVGAKNPMYGKKHSQETLLKIGQKSLGRTLGRKWINDGVQNKRMKKEDTLPDGWVFGKLRITVK
jgi:hypothetical protein